MLTRAFSDEFRNSGGNIGSVGVCVCVCVWFVRIHVHDYEEREREKERECRLNLLYPHVRFLYSINVFPEHSEIVHVRHHRKKEEKALQSTQRESKM